MKQLYNDNQEQLLKIFLEKNKVVLSESVYEKLLQYADLVIEGNEETNLISKNDAPKFLSRHIADSLVPYIILSKEGKLSQNMKWADMGSGAGCPVIPMAIVCPDIQFFAVEPRKRRVLFLESVQQKLNLKNLKVIGKRFETSEITGCDIISCRALSTFENDWERCRHALKHSGIFATLKSLEHVKDLRGTPDTEIIEYTLPEEPQQYALAIRELR